MLVLFHFFVNHGQIKSTAYIFNKTAYISDCNGIEKKDAKWQVNCEIKELLGSNYKEGVIAN